MAGNHRRRGEGKRNAEGRRVSERVEDKEGEREGGERERRTAEEGRGERGRGRPIRKGLGEAEEERINSRKALVDGRTWQYEERRIYDKNERQ